MVLVHSPSTIAVPRFEVIAHIKKGRAFWPIRRPVRVLAGQTWARKIKIQPITL